MTPTNKNHLPKDRNSTLNLKFETVQDDAAFFEILAGNSDSRGSGAIEQAYVKMYAGNYFNHLEDSILKRLGAGFSRKFKTDKRTSGGTNTISWFAFLLDTCHAFKCGESYLNIASNVGMAEGASKYYESKFSVGHGKLVEGERGGAKTPRNTNRLIFSYVCARLCASEDNDGMDHPLIHAVNDVEKELFGGNFEDVFDRPFPKTVEEAKSLQDYVENLSNEASPVQDNHSGQAPLLMPTTSESGEEGISEL